MNCTYEAHHTRGRLIYRRQVNENARPHQTRSVVFGIPQMARAFIGATASDAQRCLRQEDGMRIIEPHPGRKRTAQTTSRHRAVRRTASRCNVVTCERRSSVEFRRYCVMRGSRCCGNRPAEGMGNTGSTLLAPAANQSIQYHKTAFSSTVERPNTPPNARLRPTWETGICGRRQAGGVRWRGGSMSSLRWYVESRSSSFCGACPYVCLLMLARPPIPGNVPRGQGGGWGRGVLQRLRALPIYKCRTIRHQCASVWRRKCYMAQKFMPLAKWWNMS